MSKIRSIKHGINIIKNKTIDTIKKPLLFLTIIGLLFALISSFIIIYNSDLSEDLSYKGFNNFQEIFLFPIRLIIGSVTLFGIHIALKKYNQDKEHYQKQIYQNWDIFITTNQPFLTISKIINHYPESNNKYTINMEIKNTGKFPAIISYINLIIYNNKENIFTFDEVKYIICPGDTKTISPTFTNCSNPIFNNTNIVIEIILNYNGIDKRLNQTKISYSYDKSNNKFKEQDCLWNYKMSNN